VRDEAAEKARIRASELQARAAAVKDVLLHGSSTPPDAASAAARAGASTSTSTGAGLLARRREAEPESLLKALERERRAEERRQQMRAEAAARARQVRERRGRGVVDYTLCGRPDDVCCCRTLCRWQRALEAHGKALAVKEAARQVTIIHPPPAPYQPPSPPHPRPHPSVAWSVGLFDAHPQSAEELYRLRLKLEASEEAARKQRQAQARGAGRAATSAAGHPYAASAATHRPASGGRAARPRSRAPSPLRPGAFALRPGAFLHRPRPASASAVSSRGRGGHRPSNPEKDKWWPKGRATAAATASGAAAAGVSAGVAPDSPAHAVSARPASVASEDKKDAVVVTVPPPVAPAPAPAPPTPAPASAPAPAPMSYPSPFARGRRSPSSSSGARRATSQSPEGAAEAADNFLAFAGSRQAWGAITRAADKNDGGGEPFVAAAGPPRRQVPYAAPSPVLKASEVRPCTPWDPYPPSGPLTSHLSPRAPSLSVYHVV